MRYSYLLLFCLPLKQLTLTSSYGMRIHPVTRQCRFHAGIDLRANQDTVFAMLSGRLFIGYDNLLGLYIKTAEDGMEVTYGHISQVLTGEQHVPAGTPIAITGATGRVTGEHLHISTKYRGIPIDPLKFLYQLIKEHEQQLQTAQ